MGIEFPVEIFFRPRDGAAVGPDKVVTRMSAVDARARGETDCVAQRDDLEADGGSFQGPIAHMPDNMSWAKLHRHAAKLVQPMGAALASQAQKKSPVERVAAGEAQDRPVAGEDKGIGVRDVEGAVKKAAPIMADDGSVARAVAK